MAKQRAKKAFEPKPRQEFEKITRDYTFMPEFYCEPAPLNTQPLDALVCALAEYMPDIMLESRAQDTKLHIVSKKQFTDSGYADISSLVFWCEKVLQVCQRSWTVKAIKDPAANTFKAMLSDAGYEMIALPLQDLVRITPLSGDRSVWNLAWTDQFYRAIADPQAFKYNYGIWSDDEMSERSALREIINDIANNGWLTTKYSDLSDVLVATITDKLGHLLTPAPTSQVMGMQLNEERQIAL